MVKPRPRNYPNPALLVLLPAIAFGAFAFVVKSRERSGPTLSPRPTENSLNPPASGYLNNAGHNRQN